MDEQIERIRTMEQAMNEAGGAVEALLKALSGYEAVLPKLRALERYYENPQWMQDFDDDNAGKLPKDLPRGVLTEDALYDLLCDNDRVKRSLRSLCERLGK